MENRPQKIGLAEYLASLKRTNEGLLHIKATNLRSQQTAVTQIVGFSRYRGYSIKIATNLGLDHFTQNGEPGAREFVPADAGGRV